MAELNEIRFLLFVLLMIFPAHALDVIFSCADEDFKQKSDINIDIENGRKKYAGTLDRLIYQPEFHTTKVIVCIIDRSRYVEIMRNAVRDTRLQIARELSEWHYELVFLGIENFDYDEYDVISGFIADKIQPHPDQLAKNFIIETIGENRFDRIYYHTILDQVMYVQQYQENAQICGGRLRTRLRDFPRGALRPVDSSVESYGKEIRLYGYHPTAGEVRWPVGVVNNTYIPRVNVSDPTYNFRLRYKTKKFCLLIIGSKDYLAIMSRGRSTLKKKLTRILDEMTNNNDGLIIFGVFNFDWTEVYIVTQIILQHSVRCERQNYNVFTYGYGIFNTNYLNEFVADGRNILPQPKSNVLELIRILMGEKVRERAISMIYFEYRWVIRKIPINLGNGRYIAEGEMINYTFPWVNQKIAFIVYDTTETNNPIDYLMVSRSADELQRNGIYVVVIEAINFGLDDTHIIAEWIDYHRGLRMHNSNSRVIDSEQIVVLGGGIFDTIFQSKLTTYNTIFDTRKNELISIRNAIVNKGNGKRVFAAKLFDANYDVWRYPMNTVNGYYEPDLIPDKHMFGPTDGKKIFFIITTAHIFHKIPAAQNLELVTSMLKIRINIYYPQSNWTTFLVGLDNFGERDHHLFAELVERQTDYERALHEFVFTSSYDIGAPVYQYKYTQPFQSEDRTRLLSYISSFFGMTSYHSNGNSFPW